MNLKELRAKLDEKVARLKVLRDQETRSEAESTEIRSLLDEVKELNDNIATAKATDDAIRAFDEQRSASAGRVSGSEQVAESGRASQEETRAEDMTAGQFITSNERYTQWAERRSEERIVFEVETRALMNTAKLPSTYLQEQRLPGIRRESDIYGSLRDVLAVGTTSAESIRYYSEDEFTNNAAFVSEATATTGTSGLKPESDITFTEATANVGTIAHWMALTNFLEWNAPELRSYIDGRLIDGLNLREDEALIDGDGTGNNPLGLLRTVGVQNLNAAYFTGNAEYGAGTAASAFNRIARAKRLIQDVARSRPNFVLINPADEEFFQTLTDANGHYYAGGPFNAGLAPNFWGLRKVVNEHMPQGSVLIGDGTQAQIWDRMSARITVGLVNDQFIRNMKTVLAEKRVGLAVYKPSAFAVVELGI